MTYEPDAPVARLVPVTCTSTSPFQVTIAGGSTSVDAKRVAGSTFSVNDTGMALYAQGLAPICFKTS